MKVKIKVDPETLKMMEELREKHIDIAPALNEELEQILSQYIKEIIGNLYNIGRGI